MLSVMETARMCMDGITSFSDWRLEIRFFNDIKRKAPENIGSLLYFINFKSDLSLITNL